MSEESKQAKVLVFRGENLTKFKEELEQQALADGSIKLTKDEAIRQGLCVIHGGKATWYSAAGGREYLISGVCEPCFDEMFSE